MTTIRESEYWTKAENRRRFESLYQEEPNTGCWIWTGVTNSQGYGRCKVDSVQTGAHRVSYQFNVGPIPLGMFLDHRCRQRLCVNPDHLRIVTPTENALENSESIAVRWKARTHCQNGHPFDQPNTRVERDGSRTCRKCDALYRKTRRAK